MSCSLMGLLSRKRQMFANTKGNVNDQCGILDLTPKGCEISWARVLPNSPFIRVMRLHVSFLKRIAAVPHRLLALTHTNFTRDSLTSYRPDCSIGRVTFRPIWQSQKLDCNTIYTYSMYPKYASKLLALDPWNLTLKFPGYTVSAGRDSNATQRFFARSTGLPPPSQYRWKTNSFHNSQNIVGEGRGVNHLRPSC